MKKFISVLCVLALALTCLISINNVEVEAATNTKTYPTIKTTRCKVSTSKIYVGSSLDDAICKAAKSHSDVTKGKITITKNSGAKNCYIEITAPANGTLFLSSLDYIAEGSLEAGIGNYYKFPVYAYYPYADEFRELILEKPYIVENDDKYLAEVPMYKGETICLYFNENSTTIKASWINSNKVLSISSVKGDEAIVRANIGAKCSKIPSFNSESTNKTSLSSFVYDEEKDWRATSFLCRDKLSFTKDENYIEIQSDINANAPTYNTFLAYKFYIDYNSTPSNDDDDIAIVMMQLFTNVVKYDKDYIESNTPQILIAVPGTNIVFGYGDTNYKIATVAFSETKFYSGDIDPNTGLFVIKTLTSKLKKNGTIKVFYSENTSNISKTYTVK